MEVGDFARTKKGYIAKVSQIDNGYVFSEDTIDMSYEECRGYVDKRDIVKHSKQLIDLIEVGDYVNGRKVERIGDYEDFKRIDFEPYEDYIYEYDIKTILTHEQFEQNVFRLEE